MIIAPTTYGAPEKDKKNEAWLQTETNTYKQTSVLN